MANMDAAVPHPRAPLENVVGAEQLLAHASWARGLAARLVRDAATADDVVQRAWLAALERSPRQSERTRAWLGRVVRNLAWKERRAEARRDARERSAATPEATRGADELVAELEAQRLVVDALLAIEEPYRETLVRRWYRDEKPAAIAAAMAAPVRTVETRLARGLERLRAELTARRGAPRDWGLALLPLAWPAPQALVAGATAAGTSVLGTFAAGVVAMSGAMKLASAAIVLLAAAATWWAWPERTFEPRPAAVAAADGETPSLPPSLPLAQRDLDARDEPARAASAGESTVPSLAVRLLDDAGAPVNDFWGVLLVPGAEPEHLSSAGAAVAHVPSPARDGEVLVAGLEWAPTRAPVAAGATKLDLHPWRGVALRGRFHVEGAPPGVALQGWFHVETPFERLAHLPHDQRRWHLGHDAALPQLVLRSDATGRFELGGLEPSTSGTLDAPWGWSFAPITRTFDGRLQMTRQLAIGRISDDLAIELWPQPTIVARVIDEEGRPVDGVAWLRGSSASGGFSIEHRFMAGQLRVPIDSVVDEAIVATFVDDGASGARRVAQLAIEAPLHGVRDLGVVVLARPAARRYRLRARDGEPIERATFALLADGERRGDAIEIAAAEGDFAIDDPLADEMLVVAAGFAPLAVALAGRDADEPFELVLDRANELSIEVRAPDVEPRHVRLELTATRSPFDRPARIASLSQLGRPDTFDLVDLEESDHSFRCAIDFDSSHRPRFAALEPGVALRLRFMDDLGAVWHEETVALGAEEERAVVIDWTTPLRGFAARVVDETGQPLQGAIVAVRLGSDLDAGTCSASCDATGLAVTAPFAAERVWVTVEQNGFETFEARDVAVRSSDDPLPVVLRRAWPLQLELRRADGVALERAALESIEAWIERDGRRFDAFVRDDGRALFRDLARARARLHVLFAGRAIEQEVAPPQELAVVLLPATGRVVVRYDLPLPDEQRRGRTLRAITLEPLADPADAAAPPRGAELSTDTTLFDPPRRAGAVEFPSVLPGRYRIVLRWDDERTPSRGSLERDPTEVEVVVVADGSIEANVAR